MINIGEKKEEEKKKKKKNPGEMDNKTTQR